VDGEVTSLRKNSTSGEVLYKIKNEDLIVEELDQKEFEDALAEAQFVPLRTAPPQVLALTSSQQKSAGESSSGTATPLAETLEAGKDEAEEEEEEADEKVEEEEGGDEGEGGVDKGEGGEDETPMQLPGPPLHIDVLTLEQFDVKKLPVGTNVGVLRKMGGGFVELRCERVCEDGKFGVRLYNSEGGTIKTCFDNNTQESLLLASANNISSFFLNPDGHSSDDGGSGGNTFPVQPPRSSSSSKCKLIPQRDCSV
jgi:hypothetical protein